MQTSADAILQKLPEPNEKATLLVEDQDLTDIIKFIKRYHELHRKEYDQISEQFWNGDAKATAKALFTFLKKYVPYEPEPEKDQTIRRPSRLITDAVNGTARYNDCKHYSSFICGVVDSLNRKGYPISGNYRFVADDPGRDVHHVFAVVKGKDGGNYWVDPVLNTFDERPTFFQNKDVYFNNGVGRLTYLSGTDSVGRKRRGNLFKRLEHGISVDLQNTKKGFDIAAKQAKELALKVAIGPARNAFLALLDLNAFNLATRANKALSDPGFLNKWRDMGGNPNRLKSAIKNGLNFKAHGIRGFGDDVAGMGAVVHTRHFSTHPHKWLEDYYLKRHKGHRRTNERTAMIAGAGVAGDPASDSTLAALASAIIAALSKYLKLSPQEQAAISTKASQGAAQITQNAANADKYTGMDKADKLTDLTSKSGGQDSTMSINTGVDPNGNPQITVQDANHPALNNAGAPGGGAGSDAIVTQPPAPGDEITQDQPNAAPLANIEATVKKYAKPALITITAGLVLFKIVIPAIQGNHSKPTRKK